MAEEPDNVVQALLREIRATQLVHSADLEALQARSQRIEKQLEEVYARLEQMKQGATYDDLFSELEKSGEREAEMTWFAELPGVVHGAKTGAEDR